MALLRAGDANLRLWRKPELDPSYGETALAIYQELRGAIRDRCGRPGADACAAATGVVFQKDYKNGMFYFRRRAYDSAIIYFKDVIATYPGTSRVPDALMRLVDSYRVIGYGDELKETCTHLRRYFSQTEARQVLPGRLEQHRALLTSRGGPVGAPSIPCTSGI